MLAKGKELVGRTVALVKALVAGSDVPLQASLSGEETEAVFAALGALEPPYDPLNMCAFFEVSNSLRPNVDAYVTNIDGFGHRLEPAIDFEAEDVDARVAEVLLLERAAARERGERTGVEEPTPEEVAARRRELQQLARRERARLDAFFESCCYDHSFVHLRRITRQDLEVTGNGYWEILRNTGGDIARFVYVPSHSVRLMPLSPDPVEVTEWTRVSPIEVEKTKTLRRLRRFVQLQSGVEKVFFKSFGDPRVISRNTGRIFKSVAELKEASASDAPATEMLHFAIPSSRSPYGVPRWVGALLSVAGSRSAEEVNYLYFENKSVPPLALLVSGGKLSESSVPRIERYIEENLKGKANFHKILILEAEGPGTSEQTRPKIVLQPLRGAQQQDGLFQQYDERNIDKVGSAFRLPGLLRGATREINRATADAALRFAEDQVFQPERDEFDYLMNRRVLPDMGIRFWRFRSQTPVTRDPERLTDMVEKLMRVGVLIPEEGRLLAADIFNREFRKIGDDWTKRPLTLTLAGIQTGVEDLRNGPRGGGVLGDAKRLLSLREQLAAEEERLVRERAELSRRYQDAEDAGQAERVTVPASEFASWFEAA